MQTTLWFTPTAWDTLQCFLHASNQEISGFGRVRKRSKLFLVDDIFILPQVVKSASTDIDAFSIARLVEDLIESDRDPAEIRLWWHSHVYLPLEWSGYDEIAIQQLRSAGYMFSLVGSKRGEVRTRLDLTRPQMTFDIPTGIRYEGSKRYRKCEKEISTMVRKVAPPMTIIGQRMPPIGVDLIELLEDEGALVAYLMDEEAWK